MGWAITQRPFRYPDWIKNRLSLRRSEYSCQGEPGLLSFLTTVWNTPMDMLVPAVQSLLDKQTVRDFQWVILDNGSVEPGVVAYLKETVAADPRVVFLRVENNLGIIGGMRLVLSKATGRYILPFDSDDLLYPDAVAILTHQLHAKHYPPGMYSDEDKISGTEPCWPYFKPDWDPVLFINSCYLAHLGCMDRRLAIELGVYTEERFNGCHDWDAFTRFMAAGHPPVHIPEMFYSWRMHANSTASHTGSKSYIFDSQRDVILRFLESTPHQAKFDLVQSPQFHEGCHWLLRRRPQDPLPMLSIVLSESSVAGAGPLPNGLDEKPQVPSQLVRVSARSDVRGILPELKTKHVCITYDSVRLNQPSWPFEVTGLFELYPDTVMIGGRVVNPQGRILEAGRVPGFAGLYGCPDRGRQYGDPGNGAEMWNQRSVSGVSTHLCVMKAEFLRQVIEEFSHLPISWCFLGAWAALSAWRHKQRIVYSPFFIGVSNLDPDQAVGIEELLCFRSEASDFLPDRRFYSPHFGLLADQAYLPVL